MATGRGSVTPIVAIYCGTWTGCGDDAVCAPVIIVLLSPWFLDPLALSPPLYFPANARPTPRTLPVAVELWPVLATIIRSLSTDIGPGSIFYYFLVPGCPWPGAVLVLDIDSCLYTSSFRKPDANIFMCLIKIQIVCMCLLECVCVFICHYYCLYVDNIYEYEY